MTYDKFECVDINCLKNEYADKDFDGDMHIKTIPIFLHYANNIGFPKIKNGVKIRVVNNSCGDYRTGFKKEEYSILFNTTMNYTSIFDDKSHMLSMMKQSLVSLLNDYDFIRHLSKVYSDYAFYFSSIKLKKNKGNSNKYEYKFVFEINWKSINTNSNFKLAIEHANYLGYKLYGNLYGIQGS